MATPLPKQTAANDALIASTPYANLTQRQKDYADMNGVALQAQVVQAPAAAAPVAAAPAAPASGARLDANNNVLLPGVNENPGLGSVALPVGTAPPADFHPGGAGVAGGPTWWIPDNEAAAYAAGTMHRDPATGQIVPSDDPGAAGAAAAAASGAAGVAKDSANRDSLATIKNVLSQYGLDSLSDFAWQEIVSGRSGNEVLQDLRETPQFKQRFPAIDARQKAGLPPLSPGDYVSYENTATQYMRDAGLPPGFYDSPEDFTKFLSNDMSLKELSERVTTAKDAAYNAPTEVRSALRGQFGVGDGDLAAFFLDPDRAQPLLQRTYNAAQVAGAGTRTGYDVSTDQDYRLTDLGVTAQQAQTGFSTLQHSQELFNPLTGHANERKITSDEQLGATFGGNATAADQIEKRRQQRQSEFQDGGAFAAGNTGVTGLGSAQN